MHAGPWRGAACRNGDGRRVHALGVCRRCYEQARAAGLYLSRGPAAPGGPPDWMARGLCARPGADPDAWFPDDEDRAGLVAAVEACGPCPVRAACLSHALGLGIREGVWGGATPRQRRAMSRARVA
jgi:Transcription factor WhiB